MTDPYGKNPDPLTEEELAHLQAEEKRENPRMSVAFGKCVLFLVVVAGALVLAWHYIPLKAIAASPALWGAVLVTAFLGGLVALAMYIIGHDDKSVESEDGTMTWKAEEKPKEET